MNPKDPSPQDMENLSKAIVEAILGSADVKSALEKMNMTVDAIGKNFMVFVVNLDAVADFNKREAGDDDSIIQGPKPRRRKPVKKENLPDMIDGKQVSQNEKKFHEFLSENFDADAWLKNLKLRLE